MTDKSPAYYQQWADRLAERFGVEFTADDVAATERRTGKDIGDITDAEWLTFGLQMITDALTAAGLSDDDLGKVMSALGDPL